MGFSDDFRKQGESIGLQSLTHPFFVGIGAGSLPVERFKFYIHQDYVFLVEYARVLALACTKGDDLKVIAKFAELLHATLSEEMALHRTYCGEFGITPAELERTAPAPTTYAYTRHLLETAWSGSLVEIVASLYPYQWGYWEIGTMLAAGGAPPGCPALRQVNRNLLVQGIRRAGPLAQNSPDSLGASASNAKRARMTERFHLSSRFELTFWEMAWTKEGWSSHTPHKRLMDRINRYRIR